MRAVRRKCLSGKVGMVLRRYVTCSVNVFVIFEIKHDAACLTVIDDVWLTIECNGLALEIT